MEYITFTRCHFGVDNGRRDIARSIGRPRANVERCYTWNGTAVRNGYHNITFQDCVFEAADSFTIDIPGDIYNGAHTDSYVTLDGCTFYGGGAGSGAPFRDAIVIEGPNYVTVNNCDIYPAYNTTLSTLDFDGVDCNNWQITNNRFHLDDFSHGGIAARSTEPAIVLRGQGTFAGNTIHNSSGGYYLLWLGNYYDTPTGGLHDSTITGNHFHELRSMANPMGALWNATNSTVTGNTFQTAATSGPRLSHGVGTPAPPSKVTCFCTRERARRERVRHALVRPRTPRPLLRRNQGPDALTDNRAIIMRVVRESPAWYHAECTLPSRGSKEEAWE